ALALRPCGIAGPEPGLRLGRGHRKALTGRDPPPAPHRREQTIGRAIDPGSFNRRSAMPNRLPPATRTFCVLLAGGKGTRLHELTAAESKPALPFAGGRLVDFAMENAARSGLPQVLAATQYRAAGLGAYLLRRWSARFPAGVQLRDGHAVAPGGYRGTADALRANLADIARSGAEVVLVLSADHVYRMDYRAMIARHLASGGKATVAADTAPLDRASSFGVLSADARGNLTGFTEK